jgi:hypothetical protein
MNTSIFLSDSERDSTRDATEKVLQLRRDEKVKWAQQANVKHVQEDGNNTKYFHLSANEKHRRKTIFQLEQDEGTIIGKKNPKNWIEMISLS